MDNLLNRRAFLRGAGVAVASAAPFLDPDATRTWLARKEQYRQLRTAGQL